MLSKIILFLFVFTTTAHAHGWYERDCCANQDCFIVDSADVHQDHEGNYWYKQFKFMTEYNQVRPSRDADFHACIQYRTSFGNERPLCLYISYIQ